MSLPLAGRSILVTRPGHQASALVQPLEAQGATVHLLPAIAIEPPKDFGPLDEALLGTPSPREGAGGGRLRGILGSRSLHRELAVAAPTLPSPNGGGFRFDWIIFTSANGVEAVAKRLNHLNLPRETIAQSRLAAVGPITARALKEAFREPDLMPETSVSTAIADAILDVEGKTFLLPRADQARREIADTLRKRGGIVTEVGAYRIVSPTEKTQLPEKMPDYITLTSSSSVVGLRETLLERGAERWLNEAALACIGPVTATTVEDFGYRVAVMAEKPTVAGLVEAIVRREVARA